MCFEIAWGFTPKFEPSAYESPTQSRAQNPRAVRARRMTLGRLFFVCLLFS